MIKAMFMSKGSKEALTVLIVTHVTQVKRVESGVCGFYITLHKEYCNVTQFVTHVERVKSVKYSVYRASHPSKGEGYLFKSLPSCGFSCSPPVSLRRPLCELSWTCQTTRVIAGKTHSQSPILKTKGCSATW